MSDFLFSSRRLPPGRLAEELESIYLEDPVIAREYHGDWGSLAVTPSRYTGFAPVESGTHLCVVIGGPVLYFQDNRFLTGGDDQAGTRAIFAHWKEGRMDWSEDLSGPFAILIIDKASRRVTCITDLMMFIPVYRYQRKSWLALGTHVDALAGVCGQEVDFDEASLVDFVLHDVVTFPYSAYRQIRQCHPATKHVYRLRHGETPCLERTPYWLPEETAPFRNLGEAAEALREGLDGYIERVTSPMRRVAQFISGGEDSRVLAAMLPKRLERDSFIFLNSMTREGRIAEKVASASGARFLPDYRDTLHYLIILPEASRLVGSGHQYIHAHALGFHRRHGLADYEAVFGGYVSDTLLKSRSVRKPPLSSYFSFLPQWQLSGETRTQPVESRLFPDHLLQEVTRRRREHFHEVRAMRPQSAHEWFSLWPMTMRLGISNLYSNRRLFRSYEVFMAKEAVKVSAACPARWKLNRRLFLAAFGPYLKRTRFLLHADGRLPAFPWWANFPLHTLLWSVREMARRLGWQRRYQGSWADWKTIMASPEWAMARDGVKPDSLRLPALSAAIASGALQEQGLAVLQRVNLLQTCHQVGNASLRRRKAWRNTSVRVF
ncbi:hypothetical protein F0A17_01480 [Billgrantia pellis]|uniref:asparagine synthase (glutamine-hydrolyzing) n=1 Tax=Billgrantia pellis TaxID=2606936 RepID=A0A7V7G2G2_9GAMM|nr:hypothetical protein [Halomonas pellis]KAA0014353.1 hypothetical protein F0A17_01480 [Halomonas pellis]